MKIDERKRDQGFVYGVIFGILLANYTACYEESLNGSG